jgi:hypothetical protein
MPAILLSRLKIQAARLADLTTQPDIFVRSLRGILDFYSDRTRRPGQSGEPPPLLPAYHVPSPVLRQIMLELAPQLSADQSKGLALSTALWNQEQFECQLLAVRILGLLPVEPLEPVHDRLKKWAKEGEERVLTELLTTGLTRWRSEASNSFLGLVEEWLSSSSFHEQKMGLRALLPLIQDPDFGNLPVLFRILNPLVRVAPSQIRPDLVPVLKTLANRSPQETAYFLRHNMAAQDTAWVTRQVLTEFSKETQISLRKAMQNPQIEI